MAILHVLLNLIYISWNRIGRVEEYILTSLEKRRNREMEESTSSSDNDMEKSTSSSGSDSDDPSNKLSEVRSASHNWSHRTQGDWWSH